jgi:hypothetical protein
MSKQQLLYGDKPVLRALAARTPAHACLISSVRAWTHLSSLFKVLLLLTARMLARMAGGSMPPRSPCRECMHRNLYGQQ